jgi:hypothetical protein
MKNIIISTIFAILLSACSTTVVPNKTPSRKPLNLPTPKPLVLKEIDGKFVIGKTKEESTYVLSFKGYNDFLYNNAVISARLILLGKQLDIFKRYYQPKDK